MHNFDGAPIYKQVPEVKFEVAAYELMRSEPKVLASRLLYYRILVQHVGPKLDIPQDIAGHHLFLFERAEGENNVYRDLSLEKNVCAYVSNLFCFNLIKLN